MNNALTRQDDAHLDRPASQIDGWVAAWLDAKRGRSGSAQTHRNYTDTLGGFREALRAAGLDLDGDVGAVALALQAWAGRDAPAPATYNQRLAVLSSFYRYVARLGGLTANPADRVDRRKVEAYGSAKSSAMQTMPVDALIQRLAAIERDTDDGLRDLALLHIALLSARRLAELAGLRWRDIRIESDQMRIVWHVKGGKIVVDRFDLADVRELLEWLHRYYGAQLGDLPPGAAIWPALTGRTKGEPMKARAIAYLVERRLQTHPHVLRAQAAQIMRAKGAATHEIQAKLGHSNSQTTDRYLRQIDRGANPYAKRMAALLRGEGE